MDQTPKQSGPYKTFIANFARITALSQNLFIPIQGTIRETSTALAPLHPAIISATARVQELSSKTSSEPQGEVDSITEHLGRLSQMMTPLQTSLTQIHTLLNSLTFLHSWMIAMLVTFTEAYIDDALKILLNTSFTSTSLPELISKDIKLRWIKGILREKPPHWIAKFEKLGIEGYDPTLPAKMLKLWERRHQIIHTAEPPIGADTHIELIEAMTLLGSFVATTDAFIVASCPGA